MPLGWIDFPGGIRQVGHAGDGFAWDNEAPRHDVLHPALPPGRPSRHQRRVARVHGRRRLPHGLRSGSPTAGRAVNREGWHAPLYWEERDGEWLADVARRVCSPSTAPPRSATSATTRPTRSRAGPASACRPSSNGRSPPQGLPVTRQHARHRRAAPAARASGADGKPRQMFGDVWEWTQSAYSPYPGLPAAAGRARRIQRQVHGAASRCCAARSCVDARRPHRAPPTATSSIPTSAGSSWACALPRRSPDAERRSTMRRLPERPARARRRRIRRRRDRRAVAAAARRCRAASSTTRAAASCSRRSRGCPSTIRRAPRPRSSRRTRGEMADGVPDGGVLVEFGSGSSLQDRDAARRSCRGSAPTCRSTCRRARSTRPSERLAARFPDARCAADRRRFLLSGRACRPIWPRAHKTGFFPGSTIGNLTPVEAARLLRVLPRACCRRAAG